MRAEDGHCKGAGGKGGVETNVEKAEVRRLEGVGPSGHLSAHQGPGKQGESARGRSHCRPPGGAGGAGRGRREPRKRVSRPAGAVAAEAQLRSPRVVVPALTQGAQPCRPDAAARPPPPRAPGAAFAPHLLVG